MRTLLLLPFTLVLMLAAASATGSDREAIDALLNGLHKDAAAANFDSYFDRYTESAIFLGTDKSERWDIAQFKAYAKPFFDQGRGWAYTPTERYVMGEGDLRWFDEIVVSEKYGHCRGTGVVVRTEAGWKVEHYSLTFLVPNAVAAEVTAIGIAFEQAESQ